MGKVVEYRGTRGVVFAKVTADGENYTTGAVTVLAPVAEINKTVETASETKFYDNKAAYTINSEGADTVTLTLALPTDAVLAEITGRKYDSTSKKFIECERTDDQFALGYILGETDGTEKYVWRFKGTFSIPDETSATKDNGTGTNNISLVYTGVYTDHEFTNGKGTGVKGSAKAMFMRSTDVNESAFFSAVATPDTSFPAYSLTITEAANTTLTVTRNGVVLASGAAIFAGDVLTITVTGGTVKVNNAAFTSGNTHTVSGNTTVVSTASA